MVATPNENEVLAPVVVDPPPPKPPNPVLLLDPKPVLFVVDDEVVALAAPNVNFPLEAAAAMSAFIFSLSSR